MVLHYLEDDYFDYDYDYEIDDNDIATAIIKLFGKDSEEYENFDITGEAEDCREDLTDFFYYKAIDAYNEDEKYADDYYSRGLKRSDFC